MIRTLFIIAGAALVLCVAALGGAVALGGSDLQRHGWAWTIRNDNGESVRIERVRGDDADLGPTVTRTLAWDGGRALRVESAIDVDYIQGDAASVVITGPKGVADRVRLENGRLFLADGQESAIVTWNRHGVNGRSESDELRVVVTAPDVDRFEVNGSGELSITGYDRPALAIDIAGSAKVQASGRTDALDLDISGSGDADLEDLATGTAKVDLSGSGDARIAPTGETAVSISGSGDVALTDRPSKLTTDIAGSGDVYQD